MNKCTRCKETKPAAAFYKHKRNKSGLASHCKACENIYVAKPEVRTRRSKQQRAYEIAHREDPKFRANSNARNKRYRDKNRANPLVQIRIKNSKFLGAYGVTLADRDRMMREQNMECLGCEASFWDIAPHLDHCHATGKVRGILCMHCNSVLGHARDSQATLRRLDAYLEKSKGQFEVASTSV